MQLGSWPLGAVRMSERFLTDGEPATRKQLKALRTHVAQELSAAPWLASTGRRLVALGGTARNLAAAAQRLRDVPSFGVQGYVIELDVLDELVELLAGMSVAERGGVPGIKPERGDLILAGAAAIQGVVAAGGFDGVEVTEAGLREGVFFERLLADSDPPLIDDVRARSVWNLAGQYGVDPDHTAHVAMLALALFDDLAAAGLHPGDAIERELLWSACTVHDIGVAVDYDDHHKHSRYLVLNGGLPGFSPREVALIGQVVRFHRKGMPDAGPFAALFHKGDDALLLRCATLLRLAEDLERSRDQTVRAVHVVADGDSVRLELDADGDVSVPRWAAAREVDLFARAFSRRLVVV
jgi:exopolyphosphatase/guanosine-5'-triphosphate,3'-diphosphate pyrophosphatase